MLLKEAMISNYRSIDELAISFMHGCQTLIGINESGKSNILRALQLLDSTVEVKQTDLRIERPSESQVDSGSVTFNFELEASEIEQLEKSVQKNCVVQTLDLPFISSPKGIISLKDFCRERASGLYSVDIPTGKRSPNYWQMPDGYDVLPEWLENPLGSPISVSRAEDGKIVTIPPNGILYSDGFDISGAPQLVPLSSQKAGELIGLEVQNIIKNNLPKCIFWKYSEQYLLPSSIDVNAFCQDPNSCIPLKSMFELAGYAAGDLSKTITSAKSHSHYRYIQILRKVAEAATEHIRKVWKDHKTIRLELQPNGDLLVPLITDAEVPLDMASRSDGFKRFVSFLLQVSAKVRTSELKDVLLLIDEPEIALHPTGARSLMHELIQIGESNVVVFSTHSIFMVDRDNIGRHLIVEKKNEVTLVKRAEKSRVIDEEVLYAAMGYSIFESLKKKNVIFEGWRDKEIFRVVAESMGKINKSLKSELSEIGMTFAEGVKDVRHIARFLELASRGCLIISDSDKAAIQHRKEYEKLGSWGKWVTLQEIVGSEIVATTAEDLISRDAIIKRANLFRSKIPSLAVLDTSAFRTNETCLSALRRWLSSAEIRDEDVSAALDDLKGTLFDKIKRNEILDEAEKIVAYILEYDFSMQ